MLPRECFGLEPTADLTTTRKSWLANDKFKIVEDRMDFGHVVGEVKLQCELSVSGEFDLDNEEHKKKLMQEMDESIAQFMRDYSWAFSPREPKGKLSTYFEKKLAC
jgi:thiamine-triphosphatase